MHKFVPIFFVNQKITNIIYSILLCLHIYKYICVYQTRSAVYDVSFLHMKLHKLAGNAL